MQRVTLYDLSVIIVSYNAVDFLRLTLKSVIAACKNLSAEIYVVDNNSSDGAQQMVEKEFPSCKLIANKTNPGFAQANNQAIKEALGKYILILNPDTVIAEDTFIKIIAYMDEKAKTGGLGVRMLDGSGYFLPESKRGIPSPWASFTKMSGLSKVFPRSKIFNKYHVGYLPEKDINKIDVLSGAFMCFRKEVLFNIGLLDEDFFMYGEDIDISYRVIKSGFDNCYFAGTTIIHFKGESTTKDKVYINRFYKAMIQFAQKHFNNHYGNTLKVFIYLGVFVAKTLSAIRHIFLPKHKINNPLDRELLVLNNLIPGEKLMNKLSVGFNVKLVEDLAKIDGGSILFPLGKMTFKQMIEIMDSYKDKFTYRFLDLDKEIIIGSDNKFSKGITIKL